MLKSILVRAGLGIAFGLFIAGSILFILDLMRAADAQATAQTAEVTELIRYEIGGFAGWSGTMTATEFSPKGAPSVLCVMVDPGSIQSLAIACFPLEAGP